MYFRWAWVIAFFERFLDLPFGAFRGSLGLPPFTFTRSRRLAASQVQPLRHLASQGEFRAASLAATVG